MLASTANVGGPAGGSTRVEWPWTTTKRTGKLTLRLDGREGVSVGTRAEADALLRDLAHDGLLAWLAVHRLAHQEGFPNVMEVGADDLLVGTGWARLARRSGRPTAQRAVLEQLQTLAQLGMNWDHNAIRDVDHLIEWDPARQHITLPAPLRLRRQKRGRSRYAWIPSSLLEQDPRVVKLGVHLLLQYTNAHADVGAGLAVRLTMGTLWGWAGLREGRCTPPKRRVAATSSLERVMDALRGCGIIGTCSALTPAPAAVIDITPPNWWLAARKGIIALPTVNLAGVPRSGSELRQWRADRGMSQSQVAVVLGTSQASVSKAERSGLLPMDWRQRLRNHDG